MRFCPGRGALATERVCEVMDKDVSVLCRSTEWGVHWGQGWVGASGMCIRKMWGATDGSPASSVR